MALDDLLKSMPDDLRLLVDVALSACRKLNQEVSASQAIDLRTYPDKILSKHICTVLSENDRAAEVVSRADLSANPNPKIGSSGAVYLVDAIDGTSDWFEILKKPGQVVDCMDHNANVVLTYSINIARLVNGEPESAVVCLPVSRCIAYASKQGSAHRFYFPVSAVSAAGAASPDDQSVHNERIEVSKRSLREARVLAARSDYALRREEFQKISLHIGTIMGSFGAKCLDIAQGSSECFVADIAQCHPCTIAAPYLIVKEAGGRFSLPDGKVPSFLAMLKTGRVPPARLVVSNSACYDGLIAELNKPS
jgi:3'-phosphoadenosine 5'-phosphosulfate (PAPS) 3'-phosphatase